MFLDHHLPFSYSLNDHEKTDVCPDLIHKIMLILPSPTSLSLSIGSEVFFARDEPD
jgi:hypothetical protein